MPLLKLVNSPQVGMFNDSETLNNDYVTEMQSVVTNKKKQLVGA